MSKNALQAQLLKAGLVDSKKAKKINKQAQHAKRTGNEEANARKQEIAKAQAEKIAKDQQLNKQRQEALELKTLKANIIQMIKQHQITEIEGEVKYSFADNSKIKTIYISQKLFDQTTDGHVVIARLDEDDYALIPRPLADRIIAKTPENMESCILVVNDKAEDLADEDDPYADYVIPDDLMW